MLLFPRPTPSVHVLKLPLLWIFCMKFVISNNHSTTSNHPDSNRNDSKLNDDNSVTVNTISLIRFNDNYDNHKNDNEDEHQQQQSTTSTTNWLDWTTNDSHKVADDELVTLNGKLNPNYSNTTVVSSINEDDRINGWPGNLITKSVDNYLTLVANLRSTHPPSVDQGEDEPDLQLNQNYGTNDTMKNFITSNHRKKLENNRLLPTPPPSPTQLSSTPPPPTTTTMVGNNQTEIQPQSNGYVNATAAAVAINEGNLPKLNLNAASNASISVANENDINISNSKRLTITRTPNATDDNSNLFRVNNVFEWARSQNQTIVQATLPRNRVRVGKISVLGLFELTTRWGYRPEGQSELAAAQMAVRHINRRGILPGYQLELLTNDTMCDPGVGVDRFFHALYTQHPTRMVMLLGSACSEVTESLAKVVPYWNIVQVSFGSTSPALSDRREFPLFYRTVAPDSSHNPARIAFIRRFGWDTVTTFSQNEEIHSLAVNDLVTELERANISCAATITFAETDFKDQLKMLRDLDTRIIIGSFSHELAPKIFCEAHKLGMYGADYAWILQETPSTPWWWQHNLANECSTKHLQEAVESLIIVTSHNSIVGGGLSFSGLNNTMFQDELVALDVPQPLSQYAPQTYDAVWAMALALKGAEESWRKGSNTPPKLDRFDYTRYDMAKEFLNQFSHLNFLGVSGPVSFDGPDRICTSIFYQVQQGNLKPVALFHPEVQHLDFICPTCLPIQWQGNQVPIAKRVFKIRVAAIAPVAFYTITSLASVGITLALGFLAFNLHFRKLKTIKLSSPKLSNITAVGCILVYAAVVLLGIPAVCTARVYLLSAGFSLAFGSMFAKTYRVHRIFTHSGGSICKDKMLQDTQLISLVCALLLLDSMVITLWVVTDPMEPHLSNLTLEISAIDRSVVYQPQVEVCRSQYTQSWLSALYTYKGLLLVVGVYMAWETRHVKIPALNDSQYIGISVYSVVITSASVVVLANLLSERVTLAFIIITTFILTSTTATLCLLFIPKINDIWKKADIHDPYLHSMGLKMECNTRRFVTDDRRELQYRVEVQNRVYKKEVAALDAEILKLEKLLESNSSTSSSTISVTQHLKNELNIIAEAEMNNQNSKSRTPSISGTLPMLLLSVLPPVIPRASWPSADHMHNPMRRSVTFSSQPHIEDSLGGSRLPAIDLFNLRLRHQENFGRKGFLDRIRRMFGSRAPSRKQSTSSIGPTTGIAAALKSHMGLLSGLLPTTGSSSCHTLNTAHPDSKSLRKTSLVKSGTALNSIHIEIVDTELIRSRNRRMSTAFNLSSLVSTSSLNPPIAETNDHYVEIESEPKVNFQLPANRRPSIVHQTSQPTLRERVKGSPRFPHRIVPTTSLNALEEDGGGGDGGANGLVDAAANLLQGRLHPTPGVAKTKWKSMEESSFSHTTHQHHHNSYRKPLHFGDLDNGNSSLTGPTTPAVSSPRLTPLSVSLVGSRQHIAEEPIEKDEILSPETNSNL